MAAGAVRDIARERDRVLRRLQLVAAEIRARERRTRRNVASPRRRADDRLYRRLREINGGSDDVGGGEVPITTYPPELLPYG